MEEKIYPRSNDKQTVYLKNVITNPNIIVGEYTIYNDFVNDPRNFEKNNELGITPESISKSYSKKVWWKCKNGHEYQRHVYNERNGSGRCPICKKLKM